VAVQESNILASLCLEDDFRIATRALLQESRFQPAQAGIELVEHGWIGVKREGAVNPVRGATISGEGRVRGYFFEQARGHVRGPVNGVGSEGLQDLWQVEHWFGRRFGRVYLVQFAAGGAEKIDEAPDQT